MTVAVLDGREQRRAVARAQAAAILDAPQPARRFDRPAERLRPSARRRLHARVQVRRAPSPSRSRGRRIVAVAILLLQVILLVLGLTLPVFQVRSVSVSGTRLLTTNDVLTAASVPHQSIFTLDADSVRRRVLALPWVQSVTVTTGLPASVHITVVERQVALRVRRDGADTLIAGTGATMPATPGLEDASGSTPVLLDDRAGTAQPIASQLAQDLSALAARFPAVFGCKVAAYQWGVDDIVSLWTSTGWKAVLGHLDTQDGLASLPAQLEALGSLRGSLNFASPDFGYIDLENPASPAVGGSPGLPDEVKAAAQPPAETAAPPAAAGVPLPTPKPTPSPTPATSSSPPQSPTTSPGASPSAGPTPAPFTVH